MRTLAGLSVRITTFEGMSGLSRRHAVLRRGRPRLPARLRRQQGGGIAARAMAARSGHNQPPDYLKGSIPNSAWPSRPPRARCWCWPAPAPARRACSPPASPISWRTGLAFPSQILAVTFTNKAAREMKAAHRPAGRRGGRGHALARHLPLHRREAPAPPRRTRRAQMRLHHPRHRRRRAPHPPDHPGRRPRRQALAGASSSP